MKSGRTFWIDVEDFFQYFANHPKPSGIQRLVFETLRVLPQQAALLSEGPRIAFVRHSHDLRLLREVDFESFAIFFGDDAPKARPQPSRARRLDRWTNARLRLAIVALIQRLPPILANGLLTAGVHQLDAIRYTGMMLNTFDQRPTSPAGFSETVEDALPQRFNDTFEGCPGDVFLVLGAPWVHRDYAALLTKLRTRHAMQVAVLFYDLIPIRRPEWCSKDLVRDFTKWLSVILPLCDRPMAISHASAEDVEAFAREVGVQLSRPVWPIPIGTGFGASVSGDRTDHTLPPGLPTPGTYVLFVSTVEARKNHVLLFRVWRRLLKELPASQVPTLIFAGRVGWLVSDLMQQLKNVDWLDGKIRLLRDPTDAELTALYKGCQFTVFPSLFEGWGLPVSESLAHGRPCIASRATSVPEAGGTLSKYFDPENLEDAYHTIRAVIVDPKGLAAWQQQVSREFRHTAWQQTAASILASCNEALPLRAKATA